MIATYPRNEAGRDFVVGDIHGCFDQLCERMTEVAFDPARDRIFALGDLSDRGPQSRDALSWLEQPWFKAIRGNHEQMQIDYFEGRVEADLCEVNGGAWFVALSREKQARHVAAYRGLPILAEVDCGRRRVGLVHADPVTADWRATKDLVVAGGEDGHHAAMALWSRRTIGNQTAMTVAGIDEIYCGHSVVRDPVSLGNVHFIDTGAVFGGRLTMVQISGEGLDG